MTQVARPVEDTYYPVPPPNGSELDAWRNELEETDQNLFESINTFLPNDLTFAEAGALLDPQVTPQEIVAYVTRLTVVETPDTASEGLTVRVRLSKDAIEGHRVNCLVELREEYNNETTDLGILIASAVFFDVTEEFAEYSFEVTPEQAANIVDFSALHLRFVFTYTT